MTEKIAPGFYGKLPVTGDFLEYRLPESLIVSWSNWIQQGLMYGHQQSTATTAHFSTAPVWNFVLPLNPGQQCVQMGCLLPSHDRVGRFWPLLAMHTFTLQEWQSFPFLLAGDWYRMLGKTLLRAVNERWSAQELDTQLHALPPLKRTTNTGSPSSSATTLGWQEVARHFDPQQFISYWWSNRSDGYPHATHKHSGTLSAQLFTLLFNPAAGAQPGRNGLYPPMFDQA